MKRRRRRREKEREKNEPKSCPVFANNLKISSKDGVGASAERERKIPLSAKASCNVSAKKGLASERRCERALRRSKGEEDEEEGRVDDDDASDEDGEM